MNLKKILLLFTILSFVFFISSCNVDEDKIVGSWKGEYLINNTPKELVVIEFSNDHTGKMASYSSNMAGYEAVTACEFKWSIDGYMIKIEGTATEVDKYGNIEDIKQFKQFRYKEGKLIDETYATNTKLTLTKQ